MYCYKKVKSPICHGRIQPLEIFEKFFGDIVHLYCKEWDSYFIILGKSISSEKLSILFFIF